MRKETLDEEVQGIQSYAAFVDSWQRVSSSEVVIVTLEQQTVAAEITTEGWILSSGETFPTLEAMLKTVSPKFNASWNNELYNQLAKVRDEQTQQDSL